MFICSWASSCKQPLRHRRSLFIACGGEGDTWFSGEQKGWSVVTKNPKGITENFGRIQHESEFVMNAILNLYLCSGSYLISFLNVSLRRPLPFMVEEETVTLATTTAKMSKNAFFQIFSHLLRHTFILKCRWISLVLNYWRPHLTLEGEREICPSVFASSMKRQLREFHVVVVQ